MKWTLLGLAALLAACDRTTPPQPETPNRVQAVFETRVGAVQKANDVDTRLTDAAAARRAQLDAATR